MAGEIAPCVFCLREAADEIGDITKVNLEDVPYSSNICVRCCRHYCTEHSSPVDQKDSCLECLPLEAVTVTEAPLKSDDGVTHRGRLILPTGMIYRSLPRAIAEMEDDALAIFLKNLADQIHDTEKIQQYRKIAKATGELEQADREIAKLRALKQIKIPTRATVTITGKKGSGTSKNNMADFLAFAKTFMANKQSGAPPNNGVAAPTTGAVTPAVTAPEQVDPIEQIFEQEKAK